MVHLESNNLLEKNLNDYVAQIALFEDVFLQSPHKLDAIQQSE